MIHDLAHSHPVVYDEAGAHFIDTDHPVEHIEPLEMPDDQAERDAALKAIRWMLETIGPAGILAKVLALRFLLHMEPRSMEEVGEANGLCRAAISKYVVMFGDAMGMATLKSKRARNIYSRAQREAWKTRPRKNMRQNSTGPFAT